MFTKPSLRQQRGLTLIELIAFIVIVGVGLAGILSVLNFTLRTSADPMVQKQAVSIAESLLEEIQSKPFTYCDPDDPNATTATSTASCTTVQGITPTAGESRFNTASNPIFDNVGDYGGYSMLSGIISPSDGSTVIPGLSGYTARVVITQVGATFGLAADAVLKIDVTTQATNSGLPAITLTGYRFRYAPN